MMRDQSTTTIMELLLIIISVLIVISTTAFILHRRLQKPRRSHTLPYPPGRTGWPLIGENLEYFSKVRKGINENFVIDRRNKYSSDVFKSSLLREHMAFLTGPEGNKFLFSNENKLVQVWWPGSIDRIFPKSRNKTTKDESIKIRKMLPAFLKADALKNYIDIMDSKTRQHLRTHWVGQDRVKVGPMVRKCTFELACRLLLGIDDAQNLEKLITAFDDLAAGLISIPINLPGTAFNRAVKASKEIREGIEGMIKQKKKDILENNGKSTVSKDILSHMLLAADSDGEATCDSDIAIDMLGLLVAGHDTLTSALTFTMMFLAEYPDVYQKVLREQMEIANSKEATDQLNWEDLRNMRYSWNVACEVLRLRGPSIGAFREAITDFTYAGHMIPKGWKLHYVPNFTHKNSEYFPNPENFDPSRFEGKGPVPYTFVPFGGGPRMCPGNEYARAGILVFMHNVVTKFRWEKLIPNEKVVNGLFPSAAQGLPILLHPHNA